MAWFPESEGWVVAPKTTTNPAHRFEAVQTKEGNAAAVWNYGSLVLVFHGDAGQMPQFAAPNEVAAARTSPTARSYPAVMLLSE